MKKVLLYLLLVVFVATVFQASAQPPIPESRTERHNGNMFFFPAGKMDTIEVVDPVTGETVMQTRISNGARPSTMNGNYIHNNAEATPPFDSRTERHNGNVFFFPAGKMDTIEALDPVTGETVMQARILNVTRPITMNGKHIYNNAEVTTPVERRNDIIPFSFEEYILNKIKPDLATLKDGSYYLHLDNIVVDKNGVVQYYSCDTLSALRKAVAREMKRPLFVPARIGNKKVTAIYESYTASFEIVVKNHNVTFIRDKNFPGVKSNM